MARYIATNSGTAITASSTAATAGIIKVDETGTPVRAAITRFHVFPQGAANDTQYVVRVKRQTTAGTWTNAITPAPLNSGFSASNSTSAFVSSAAGSASTVLGNFGYNFRAGLIWVAADDDGRFIVPATANYGVILEWVYAQGTDNHGASIEFSE